MTTRNEQLVNYIAGAATRTVPPEVDDAARRALVDFLGVAVGASNDAPARPVRATDRKSTRLNSSH